MHKRIVFLLCILPHKALTTIADLTFFTKLQKVKNILQKVLTKKGSGDIIVKLSA